MNRLAILCAALALSACATTAPAVVTGNGGCHPSQDLPAHKVMKKVPEVVTPLEDLWALLGLERKDHAGDIRDYNSLYDQCVDKGPAPAAPK
jgi:hypothetical protein